MKEYQKIYIVDKEERKKYSKMEAISGLIGLGSLLFLGKLLMKLF